METMMAKGQIRSNREVKKPKKAAADKKKSDSPFAAPPKGNAKPGGKK